MGTGLQVFTSLLMVQMFYALAVTLIVAVVPGIAANQIVAFTNNSSVIQFTTLASAMQGGVSNQFNIPLLDFGALIFYSTSILLNLMVNFFTAIPQMLSILVQAIFIFIPIDMNLQIIIKGTFITIMTILYYLYILSFIMSTRTPLSPK